MPRLRIVYSLEDKSASVACYFHGKKSRLKRTFSLPKKVYLKRILFILVHLLNNSISETIDNAIMQNVKEEKSTIRALSTDVISPPLAVRLTIKAMRTLFISEMFKYSFLPFFPFKLFTFDNSINWFIAYSVIVSIWGFAVWVERAYRNKVSLQPPRCTKIRCSRCNTKKIYPKWFKYKHWMYFFLLYASLTFFVLITQVAFFMKEMSTQGAKLPSGREMTPVDYSSLLIIFEVITALIHLITARVFKEYYLHNDPLETGDRTSTDEKKSASEEAII